MAALADVRSLLAGTLDDVDRIASSPALLRELLNDLRTAERQVAGKLRKEVLKHGTMDARFTGAQAQMYQQHVATAIDYVTDRLRGRTEAQARAAIKQSLARSVTLLEGLEKRFSGVTMPVRLREAAQLRTAAGTAHGMWARSFPTSVDRYGAKMLSEFEEIMRAGLASGATHDDMVAALTGHGGPTGMVSMAAKITPQGVLRVRESDIPEGLFVRHKYWAERLVRTELLRAYNGARQVGLEEQAKQFPDMKRKIVAILDKRTAPDSLGVHGQIRGIKENFVDGAGRSYLHPPARPNDRETVIPWRADWEASAGNTSEWEKACLGELDADAEAELEKTMRAIAAGRTVPPPKIGPKSPKAGPKVSRKAPKPKPSVKVKPPTPALPMEQPKPKVGYHEAIEADLRGRLKWGHLGIELDGEQVGAVVVRGDRIKVAITDKGGFRNLPGDYPTKDIARAALESYWHGRLAKSARMFDEWDFEEYKKAAKTLDGTKMRALIRGGMLEAGALARDALYAEKAVSLGITTDNVNGYHYPDGRIELNQSRIDNLTSDNPWRRYDATRTAVHEELHGASKMHSMAYRGVGAAIEEVSVETAARLITPKLTGFKMDSWMSGSYQDTIDHVTRIVAEESFGVPKNVIYYDKFKMEGVVGRAGIKMRAGDATGAIAMSPDDMVDQFVDALDVPEATKPAIAKRLRDEVKLP